MQGGSRKGHTKSRNGCGQCKSRRKKCDQRPPTCGNCQKKGIVCDYTAISAAVEQIASQGFISSVEPEGSFLTYSLPSPTTLNPRDQELYHHYSAGASLTLSDAEERSIWQVNVPQEARTHDYVLHTMLAISALHLAYVRPITRDKYVHAAHKHHEQALECFTSSVTAVHRSNGGAFMAFSFLTVAFTSGLDVVSGFAETPSPIDSFVKILRCKRQARSTIVPIITTLEKGKFRLLLGHRSPTTKFCPMHIQGNVMHLFLLDSLENSSESEAYKVIYRDAITFLWSFFSTIPDRPLSWAQCLYWPTSVSSEFFRLLEERRPFALILLAFWCIPLYRAPNLWFNLWAKKVVEEVWFTLEDKWRSAAVWPAEQTGVIPKEDHSSNCICLDCADRMPVVSWKKPSVRLSIRERGYGLDTSRRPEISPQQA